MQQCIPALDITEGREQFRPSVFLSVGRCGEMWGDVWRNMIDRLEIERQVAAKRIVGSLKSQPGVDTILAATNRFLSVVHAHTGYDFKMVGKGRSRYVYAIFHPEFDLGLVLKIGNKVSNDRETVFTLGFPEDWAKIYATFDFGMVSERVSMVEGFDDPRITTNEFKARIEALTKRYEAIKDVGFIGDRIVLVGSSVRLK